MVFSSFPTYIPDPSNWQQQPTTATTVSFTGNTQFLPPPPPLSQPPPQQQPPPLPPPFPHGVSGHGSSVRPGSMAERARLANIPMPEAALKCPRCESTNTKFCYFNNYSLSQPRHFCKTCRRYWTRGGALRNVPVGGGCRRNKRTKATSSNTNNTTSSKSQDSSTSCHTSSDHLYHRSSAGAAAANLIGPTSSFGSLLSSYNAGLMTGHDSILGLGTSLPSLKLMPPNSHHEFTNSENFGIQYGGVSAPHDITTFHLGGGGGGGGGASGLLSSFEQWRFPVTQLPLGLDIPSPSSSSGLYPFDQTGMEHQPGFGVTGSGQSRPRNNIFQNISSSSSHSAMVTAAASELASVKVEGHPDQLNLSRQLFGSDQLWNATAAAAPATTTGSWSDVSNFSSSSTSNPI